MSLQRAIQYDFPKGIAPESGCLDGHFPDNPIVPGAFLLGIAEAKLSSAGWRIEAARRVKFLVPLKPEQPFSIHVIPGKGRATLSWVRRDIKIAEASVTLRATA